MAQPAPPRVTVGVDTHKDLHVAAARDQLGRRLASTTVPASATGYAQLLAWARALGEVTAWGVEGTGSYGAGLARFLAAHHQWVVEVNRPDRATRRRHGKSDPVDADAAARSVQAGQATSVPKAQDGVVEMLRALRVARASAVKARTQAVNAIKALLVTAPTSSASSSRACPPPGWSATPPRSSRPAGHPDRGGQAGPARPGTALPASRCRDYRTHRAARSAHRHARPGAARPAWRRPRRRRRAAGRLRRQPRAAALRGRVRRAVRRLARGGLLGQDPPAPAQPWRRPPGQRGTAPHRGGTAALAPAHPRLSGASHHPGQDQKEVVRCLKRYVAREVFAVLGQLDQQQQASAA
jgi:Transposase